MAEPAITRQAAHVSAGSNLPVTRIVIHATCPDVGFPAASAHGSASGTARYFGQQSSGGSAHYVEGIDAEEHCVADNAIAWHAPPNPGTIGVEITADGGDASAYGAHPERAYTRAQWLSPQVWPAVVRAAARVAELCARFGVPAVLLSVADVRAGHRGICGHVTVSQAFGQTDHTDPGPNFPWAEFMALVTGHTSTAPSRGETRPPLVAPKPAPAPASASGSLKADGVLGAQTIRRLQEVLGTPVDGVITPGNSSVVRTMQQRLGVTADGDWGPLTTRALQKHYGTPVDGVLSHPSTVIAALQRALNAGRF